MPGVARVATERTKRHERQDDRFDRVASPRTHNFVTPTRGAVAVTQRKRQRRCHRFTPSTEASCDCFSGPAMMYPPAVSSRAIRCHSKRGKWQFCSIVNTLWKTRLCLSPSDQRAMPAANLALSQWASTRLSAASHALAETLPSNTATLLAGSEEVSKSFLSDRPDQRQHEIVLVGFRLSNDGLSQRMYGVQLAVCLALGRARRLHHHCNKDQHRRARIGPDHSSRVNHQPVSQPQQNTGEIEE
jgi:hypothetical protein